MTWDDIATIAAVVRTKSFLAAAKELGLRHSSVSRRIAAIEEELGEPLFLRNDRRLRATALAEEVESHASAMSIAARRLDSSLAARRSKRGAEIVITTSSALSPLLIRALARVKTETKIRLVLTDQERTLEPGTIDVALRPTGSPSPSLRGRKLGTLAIAFYRRRNTSLTNYVLPSESMQRLATLRWLNQIPKTDESISSSRFSCDTLLSMRDACLAGLGQALLPTYLTQDLLERVGKPLRIGTPLWLFTASQRDTHHQPFTDALFRSLKSEKDTWLRS